MLWVVIVWLFDGEMGGVEYWFYGYVLVNMIYLIGVWFCVVGSEIVVICVVGKILVLVGGMGFYFKVLMGGLFEMLEVFEELWLVLWV